MADGVNLTETGRDLLAQTLIGKTLTFTRAFIGDGILPASSNPAKRTSLISPKLELPIQSINKTDQIGTCEIVLEISNKDLKQGFFVNEYGLFARIDNGAEFLYAYRNTGANLQFLPGDNGVDLIHYSLSLITIIAQAPNVTAIINSQNSYVTVPTMEGKILSLFSGQSDIKGFWTYGVAGEKILRPQSLDTIKQIILGTGNVSEIVSRLERLEDNLAQVLLSLEMKEMYPEYTHYIIEDFRDTSQLDMFEAKITSIITGDDSVDCLPLDGIIPGSWYTITDGINSEQVQVHSVNKENNILRVILEDVIKNTYHLNDTHMFRTSASIAEQEAYGSESTKIYSWSPSLEWSGFSEGNDFILELDSSTANQQNFSFTENAVLTSDGFFSLMF